MSSQKKLQVPITDKLKSDLKKRSEALGFSSVNEAVRVVLHNFASGQITLQLMQSSEIPMVDSKTDKDIEESIIEFDKGDYEVLNPFDFKSVKKLKE